jgi:hypothetical protein
MLETFFHFPEDIGVRIGIQEGCSTLLTRTGTHLRHAAPHRAQITPYEEALPFNLQQSLDCQSMTSTTSILSRKFCSSLEFQCSVLCTSTWTTERA